MWYNSLQKRGDNLKNLSIVGIGLTISTILFIILSPIIILLILLRLCTKKLMDTKN